MRTILIPLFLLPLLLPACSSSEEEGPACPSGMVLVQGGRFVLGEGDDPEHQPNQFNAVIRSTTVEVGDFCVDTYPFPGRAGAAWPTDGLGRESAQQLDELMAGYRRRLCTVSELLVAAAGPHNWRYPYDAQSYQEGTCDPEDSHPHPMGSFEGCVSPAGVRDFQVRSAWARLGGDLRAHLATYGAPNRPPHLGGGMPEDTTYAVWGGTSRRDTFYSPNNFGVHGHNADEGAYWDDTTRACADPGRVSQRAETSWATLIDGFVAHGSYEELLRGAR